MLMGRDSSAGIARGAALGLACVALTWTAQAGNPRPIISNEQWQWVFHLLKEEGERPVGPLRYENISDNEVREVVQVVAGVDPGAIVNIGGVVEGCACEEGPFCEDQVGVLSYHPDSSKVLTLSRIAGHWQIGRTQGWLFQWAAFRDKYSGGRPHRGEDPDVLVDAYEDERIALIEGMPPRCEVPAAVSVK